MLTVGQRLRLPATTPAAEPQKPRETTSYRVQAGDNLQTIGIRFGVPWQQIAEANNLTGRSVLRVGQELVIPGVQ